MRGPRSSSAVVRALAVLGLSLGSLTGVAPAARGQDLAASSSVTPAVVRVGQVATYTGTVVVPHERSGDFRFLPPDTIEALTWGPLRAARHPHGGTEDTLVVQAELQAFHLGSLDLPGMRFTDRANPQGAVLQLPDVRLTVVPVIAATDSTADLHPVRGPLGAPWWEVVPWLLVLTIAGIAGLATWLVVRMFSRVRRPVVTFEPAARRSPAEAALERLTELRGRRLPEAGQFGQHALELTSILRRFLEATTTRLRPGFSTSELTNLLKDDSIPAPDALLLVSLMRVWDRVKFARAPFTVDEARKSEDAVESFVRRRAAPPKSSEEAA
jgi:hypothetical protein